ncbi:MAG: CpsD/CapB family tyrosine-protein kinase [Candidatus Binatia bacterium]
MSRIYDALKKLESERGGAGDGAPNGHGNGHGNGSGKRWGWSRFFGTTARSAAAIGRLSFELGPEVEEAFQRLGTNLLVGPGVDVGRGPRLLGITSSQHGEGTTTTAGVFGSILVRRRGGRVAVVEANYRAPSFESVFNVHPDAGFAELVEGRRTVTEVAQQTDVPDLFVVTGGHTLLGPSGLFDSPGMAAALDQLRSQFAFVLFDLPPVNVYSDASILGPRLDAALIVIEADRTRIPEVERTRRSLERVGARVVGAVLNRRRNYIPAVLEEML